MSPQRNDPCPCGSGLKLKKCCLSKERPPLDSEAFLWRRLNAVDEKLGHDLLRFSARALGEEAMDDACEDFLDGSDPEDEVSPEDMQTFVPWMLYAWRPFAPAEALASPTVAGSYLARHGSRLDAFEREYLEASVAEPFSMYEVIETIPGEAVLVEDLLRGGRQRVHERSASGSMRPRDVMWAHVVTVQGFSTFSGVGTVMLEPTHKLEVIDTAEEIRGGRKAISTADLHERGDLLRELYVSLRFERLHPRRPELRNTDGEALAMQRLELRLEDPEAAFAKLADLEVMRPAEERERDVKRDGAGKLVHATIAWQKRGNKKMKALDNTILGQLTIDGRTLTVEVNSNKRAKRIRKEIEKRLGTGVTFVRSVITSIEKAIEEAQSKGPRPPSREEEGLRNDPELNAQIAQLILRQYEAWADEKIPALGGKTPRQAVKSAAGRKKVEVLIADAEARGMAGDPETPLDLGFLRRELGLEGGLEETRPAEPRNRDPIDAGTIYTRARRKAEASGQRPEASAIIGALTMVESWCVNEGERDQLDERLDSLFKASSIGENALDDETENEFGHHLSPRLPFDVLIDGDGDDERATAADLFLKQHGASLPEEAVEAVNALVAAEDTVARLVRQGADLVIEDLVASTRHPFGANNPLPEIPFYCRLVILRGLAVPLAITTPAVATLAAEMLEERSWVLRTSSESIRGVGIRMKTDTKAYGLGSVILQRALESLSKGTKGPKGAKKRR